MCIMGAPGVLCIEQVKLRVTVLALVVGCAALAAFL